MFGMGQITSCRDGEVRNCYRDRSHSSHCFSKRKGNVWNKYKCVEMLEGFSVLSLVLNLVLMYLSQWQTDDKLSNQVTNSQDTIVLRSRTMRSQVQLLGFLPVSSPAHYLFSFPNSWHLIDCLPNSWKWCLLRWRIFFLSQMLRIIGLEMRTEYMMVTLTKQ